MDLASGTDNGNNADLNQIQNQFGIPPMPPADSAMPAFDPSATFGVPTETITGNSTNSAPTFENNGASQVMQDLTNQGPAPILEPTENTNAENTFAAPAMDLSNLGVENTAEKPAEATTEVNTEAAAPAISLETAAPATPEAAAPAINLEAAAPVTPEAAIEDSKLEDVKKQMLQDLYPLMDKIKINPDQKFKVYKQMIESTGDKEMITAAYDTAKSLTDETERAEALLYLIEKADN